jgi:FKBP-type peptidyl-prolyl cis-trans isomerase FkpA
MRFLCKVTVLLSLSVLFLTNGCRPETQVPSNRAQKEKRISDELLKINHYMVKRNQELIENFVKRTGWKMQRTGTGLWYMILEHGNGPAVRDGKVAVFNFRLRLLDGEVIDSTSTGHPDSFIVGHGSVEAGLEEGIRFLHEGDSARFILPPHLAHGNFGDSQKIPPGAILLYDLKLLAVR